ncbi:zonadhesin [Drosophila montana]|uniref:zonadhesin n=1 Tax=Drosophila montana TaxID=40370 RepID=UPI00313AACFE
MKYTIGVCLVLAAACNAAFLDRPVNFQPFVELQHNAMRSLISAHASNDDPNLINNCFNQYISDQMNVLDNYNKIYTGCVTTAQREKTELTAQSTESRKDLLTRSDGMCSSLGSCDLLIDGLDFFDCYRNASADSYKVMFTLNSDANSQFNTISTRYGLIDSDLTQCVDEARLEYARDLEKCDSDFNICISGGEVTSPPTTDKPVDSTPVVTTDGPIVTTEGPIVTTERPIVTTEGPAVSTDAPAVSTDAPAVSTDAPAVSTDAPAVSTDAPAVSTDAPAVSTDAPAVSTDAPAVSTDAPAVSTDAPAVSTDAPAVSTDEPAVSTDAPAVSTDAPAVSTNAPAVSTDAPAVSTDAPAVSTDAPAVSTDAPAVSTDAPAVSTDAPAVSTDSPIVSTQGPSGSTEPTIPTEAPVTTTERMPEEDIQLLPLTFRSALDKLRRFF